MKNQRKKDKILANFSVNIDTDSANWTSAASARFVHYIKTTATQMFDADDEIDMDEDEEFLTHWDFDQEAKNCYQERSSQ